jgi:hypothetical protein
MKTTIKAPDGDVIVEPMPGTDGTVQLTIRTRAGSDFATIDLTQDRAGALIFGMEQAAEAARIAQERQALAA